MSSGQQPFLRGLAKLFFEARGKELYRYRFFFVSRRAGQFFCHYLQQESADQPLILPQVTTLPSYLRQVLGRADEDVNSELLILFHLYQSYREQFKESDFTFDSFYEIGQQLLADFNDVDNQLKDIGQIYDNMHQLAKLTVPPEEYLEEAQIVAMQQFVQGNLTSNLSQQYTNFWAKVPEIYRVFRERLKEEGLYYNGMLMREITEQIKAGELNLFEHDQKVNVFVGFNALSTCEQMILRHFREESEALFYWDYDNYLLKQSFTEKSREESMAFPEPTGELAFNRDKESQHKPQLEIISIPSKLGQAAYVAQEIIGQIEIAPQDPNTAIILPDESQLSNLLSHLSTERIGKLVKRLNITMGFPVKYLPVIAKLIHLISLQKNAYRRGTASQQRGIWRREEVIDLFGLQLTDEPYEPEQLLQLDRGRKLYFSEVELSDNIPAEYRELRRLFYLNKSADNDLISNTLGVVDCLIQRHREDKSLRMGLETVSELLREIGLSLYNFMQKHPEATEDFTFEVLHDIIHTTISRVKVSFAGEPLEGVQVMGILEARCIDFENVIILDAGEGILPTKSRKYGLITQGLRQANGLPTYKWQDHIRAYNFFHMISRAERVFALYDSRRGERASGEPSRYLTLLTHVYGVEATEQTGYFPISPLIQEEAQLDMERIEAFRAGITSDDSRVALSPSAIINYLACPRKFYYQNILKLREEEEVSEILEKNDMGSIIHKTMELLYKDLQGQLLTVDILEQKKQFIPEKVKEAYISIYGSDSNMPSGYFELYRELIVADVVSAVEMDIEEIGRHGAFTYMAGEYLVMTQYKYSDDHDKRVNLKGYIDRIDSVGGNLRLIDYKTGGDTFDFDLDKSFAWDSENKIDRAAVQLLTYCEMIKTGASPFVFTEVAPYLFKPRAKERGYLYMYEEKKKAIEVNAYSMVEEPFRDYLKKTLTLIVEEDNLFVPNNLKKYNCDYCVAKELCHAARCKK